MMITPDDHSLWALRHDLRSIGVFVGWASFIANFLPREKRLARWPRTRKAYSFLCDCVAFVALNWRACLPSLDLQLFGFHVRRVRYDYGAVVLEVLSPDEADV